MRIKDIVCDFEYAFMLKELGLKKYTLFFVHKICHSDVVPMARADNNHINTFTVAELGEMLPEDIVLLDNNFCLKIGKFNELYEACYCWHDNEDYENTDLKLANVLAKLLIELINDECLTVEELNEKTLEIK